jgi:P-type E1-E2 ATPase
MAGRIDTVCFDKTGTLTEDGMSLKGLSIIKNESLTQGFLTKLEEIGRSDIKLFFRRKLNHRMCTLQSWSRFTER